MLILIAALANAYHETDDDEAAPPGNAPFPMDGCNCAALANGNINGSSLLRNGSGNVSGGYDDFEIQAFDANGTTNGTCAPKQELSKCQQEDADKQASYDGRWRRQVQSKIVASFSLPTLARSIILFCAHADYSLTHIFHFLAPQRRLPRVLSE